MMGMIVVLVIVMVHDNIVVMVIEARLNLLRQCILILKVLVSCLLLILLLFLIVFFVVEAILPGPLLGATTIIIFRATSIMIDEFACLHNVAIRLWL